MSARYDRQHGASAKPEQRSQAQRDRDRLLYSSSWRRLGAVTQVADPHRSAVFHTRLTHSLEVAQIGRRLAEKLRTDDPALAEAHGIDPDVVEAAALAHDIGHPPFGHVGEEALDRAVRLARCADGFEGNAQSFRVVTRLSAYSYKFLGLDLTRATLNAILKYPWLRRHDEPTDFRFKKFGAYRVDNDAFQFARAGWGNDHKSAEAAIMDYADSVAYSVHDIQDFYKVGLIPSSLLSEDDEFNRLFAGWIESGRVDAAAAGAMRARLRERLHQVLAERTYTGTRSQRAALRTQASVLIQEAIYAVKLSPTTGTSTPLLIDEALAMEHKFFQRVLWRYVIEGDQLGTQQYGQRRVIGTLFDVYAEAIKGRSISLIPSRFRDEYHELAQGTTVSPDGVARLAADIVASLTDAQAVEIYRRFTGMDTGSVLDMLRW